MPQPIEGIESVPVSFTGSWILGLEIIDLIPLSYMSHMAEMCACVASYDLGIHNEKQSNVFKCFQEYFSIFFISLGGISSCLNTCSLISL